MLESKVQASWAEEMLTCRKSFGYMGYRRKGPVRRVTVLTHDVSVIAKTMGSQNKFDPPFLPFPIEQQKIELFGSRVQRTDRWRCCSAHSRARR